MGFGSPHQLIMDYKLVKKCRVCGSAKLKKYIDFGEQPLANSLKQRSKKYPLKVLLCQNCHLSQLSIVVKPEILFKDYPYHSSISNTFKEHCSKMARTVKRMLRNYNPLVVDIASNDGALLSQFKEHGFYVMGVEPSKNLAKESNDNGIDTINEFFSQEVSERIPACHVVTATNVLAHVDDLYGFIKPIVKLIKKNDNGFLVVEVPYLYDLISKNQFDTIYHEHLSYFLLKPLVKLFESCGLPIFKVERHKIHGGSIRIYASPYLHTVERSVQDLLDFEDVVGMYELDTYLDFEKRVRSVKFNLVRAISYANKCGLKVVGYGASAKGTMLINQCGIKKSELRYVVDDTPDKQGRNISGSNIPIVHFSNLKDTKPNYILLLAWNFSKEIMDKTKDIGARYIIPIPEVVIT